MRPITYWSRVNSAAERKWATVKLELSAIVMALRNFQPYIYGMKVIVHSDPRQLIYLMTRKGTHPNLARWVVELMQYDLYIEHVAGAINQVAECLSRIADEIPESDVKHLPDAEDIFNFQFSLYCAAQTKTQGTCMINEVLRTPGDKVEENVLLSQRDNKEERIPPERNPKPEFTVGRRRSFVGRRNE